MYSPTHFSSRVQRLSQRSTIQTPIPYNQNPTETLSELWSHWRGFHFAEDGLSASCHPLPSSWHYVFMLSQGRLTGISPSQPGEHPDDSDREPQKIILMLRENNANLITLS